MEAAVTVVVVKSAGVVIFTLSPLFSWSIKNPPEVYVLIEKEDTGSVDKGLVKILVILRVMVLLAATPEDENILG